MNHDYLLKCEKSIKEFDKAFSDFWENLGVTYINYSFDLNINKSMIEKESHNEKE